MSPRAFTDNEREFVKRKLIDSAQGFLSTTCIKKTTVEDLTRAAGISKGAFYQFYESKELLFLDALEEEQERIHNAIITELGGQADIAEAFVTVLYKMYGDFSSKPWLITLAQDEYEALLRRVPPERIEQHIKLDDEATSRLVSLIGGNMNTDAELLSAVMRMLFMCILHKREIGERFDEAFMFILEALAAKLFGEDAK